MARYRRYRRTIVRAPKKKWGSNLINLGFSIQNTETTAGPGFYAATLASNKTETTAPTPVIVKTGNFKLQGDLEIYNGGNTAVRPVVKCFIVFVPQGIEPLNYNAANTIIQSHPEWIMSWRVLDTSVAATGTVTDCNRFSVSSRLKRNLNSGDSIYLIVLAQSIPPSGQVGVQAMCQFWTCAN